MGSSLRAAGGKPAVRVRLFASPFRLREGCREGLDVKKWCLSAPPTLDTVAPGSEARRR